MHPFLEACWANKITPDQYAILWYQKEGIKSPHKQHEGIARVLMMDGFLDDRYKPTLIGMVALRNIDKVFKSLKPTNISLISQEQIAIYKAKWPKGKGASTKEITDKFIRLFEAFPEWSGKWEQIQIATDLYLQETSPSSQFHFSADHFIIKSTPTGNRYSIVKYLEMADEPAEEIMSIYKIN